MSQKQLLEFGVPQGSVLGPKAYTMYTRPVGTIIQHHGLTYHCYADDAQLYISLRPTAHNQKKAIAKMENCVNEIRKWMKLNLLKLNDEKTEFIVFSSKYWCSHCEDLNIDVGGTRIIPVTHVRNLGVIFDCN